MSFQHPANATTQQGTISGLHSSVAATTDYAGLGLIGLEVMPLYLQEDPEGTYYKVDPAQMLTAPDDSLRAPGADFATDETDLEEQEFVTKQYARRQKVPYEHIRKYQDEFDALTRTTEIVTGKLYRAHERRVAAKLFNTTTYPLTGNTGLGITHEWDDPANAVPFTDITTGIEALYSRGVNIDETSELLLVLPDRATYRNLCATNQAREIVGGRYVYGADGELAFDELAGLLGVDKIVFPNMPNYSDNGTLSKIWNPEYAALVVRPRDPSPQTPTDTPQWGRTIAWDVPDVGGPFSVSIWNFEGNHSYYPTVMQHVDEHVINDECAFLFGNVNTI